MRPNGLLRRLMPRRLMVFEGRSTDRIALTFDDGPTPGVTERVLEALVSRGHTATFFVLGSQAEAYPGLVDRIVATGCELGNHSYSHRRIPGMRWSDLGSEFAPTDQIIARHAGSRRPPLRPPGGALSLRGIAYLAARGRPPILWSVLVPHEDRKTAGEIIATLESTQMRGGDIVLLHDERNLGDAIDGILDLVEAMALRSVTVSELLGPAACAPSHAGRRAGHPS